MYNMANIRYPCDELLPNLNRNQPGPFSSIGNKKKLRTKDSYMESFCEKKKPWKKNVSLSKRLGKRKLKNKYATSSRKSGKVQDDIDLDDVPYRRRRNNNYYCNNIKINNIQQAQRPDIIGFGENGRPQLTTSGSAFVDLFFNTVRSTSKERLHELLDAIFVEIETKNSSDKAIQAKLTADVVLAMVHLRATRLMGKGERQLFVYFIAYLNKKYPETMSKVITEVPFYGCFKDLLEIVAEIYSDASDESIALRKACLKQFAKKLKEDVKCVDDFSDKENFNVDGDKKGKKFISMAAKWAPREGKSFDKKYKVVDEIATYMFSKTFLEKDKHRCRKSYRRVLSKLTKYLNIPEILMSAKKWREINFSTVPSVCLNKFQKAFMNENVDKRKDHFDNLDEKEDRISCRNNLIAKLVKGNINGKQLFPHEISRKVLNITLNFSLSDTEKMLANAQWISMRDSVRKLLNEQHGASTVVGDGEINNINLGNIVPLVDVSGSMHGEPMEVAIALGILISELAHPAFKDRVLTFSSTPEWHQLDPTASIFEKVQSISRAKWGMSTNFSLAIKQIYKVVKCNKLKKDEVPDLIVFSDMQFDSADSGWSDTVYNELVQLFAKLGREICGVPYNPPRLIFWNLRSSSSGIHAAARHDCENVQLLSGFSPSLMQLLLAGEEIFEEEEVKNEKYGLVEIKKVRKKMTPYETFRKAIDNDCFDRIRAVLNESKEGYLAHYNWYQDGTKVAVENNNNTREVAEEFIIIQNKSFADAAI